MALCTGCTVHLVTEEVDAGPILVQKRCTIDAADNADTLKAKVQHLGMHALRYSLDTPTRSLTDRNCGTEGVALIEAVQLFEQQEKQKRKAEETKRQQRREKRKAAEGQGPVRHTASSVVRATQREEGQLNARHMVVCEQVTYRSAGVDIDAGNLLVERIKPFTKATARPGTSAKIGNVCAHSRVPLRVPVSDKLGAYRRIRRSV
jgi:methionyl-tRNA formyltransferase